MGRLRAPVVPEEVGRPGGCQGPVIPNRCHGLFCTLIHELVTPKPTAMAFWSGPKTTHARTFLFSVRGSARCHGGTGFRVPKVNWVVLVVCSVIDLINPPHLDERRPLK